MSPSPQVKLARLIHQIGYASSVSEAKRLIKQGAVEVDGKRITDPETWLVVVRE